MEGEGDGVGGYNGDVEAIHVIDDGATDNNVVIGREKDVIVAKGRDDASFV